MDLPEDYGVIVGCTLVDASSWSASVLMVNPNADEIVLPSFACVGNLVPVSTVSVALAEPVLSGEEYGTLPDHLEDIVTGSHPSLGEDGRLLLKNLLHRYAQPVMGHTTSVQHEILTSDTRPVQCGLAGWLWPVSERNRCALRKCCWEDRLNPAIVHGSPVDLVTKKDGSTCFSVDYRRLNSLTIKDAYPLPRHI